MARGTAARRYAKALFDLAREEGGQEAFERDLSRFAALLEGNEDLREVLLNPVFEIDARKRIAREIAGRLEADRHVANFLCLLLDTRKFGQLPEILRVYRELADRAAGRVHALLVAATAVDRDATARVEAELSKWTGKQVRLETRVDQALIGGVVARVGDLVLDGSIRTQLDQLRTRLARGS